MQEQANAESAFYEVEEVLDRKLIQGKVYYLIKWRNYSEAEATWQYARRLPYIKPLIRKFNTKTKSSCSLRNISTIISDEDSSNTPWGDSDKKKHSLPSSPITIPAKPQKHKKQSSSVSWRLPIESEGKSSGNQRSWKERRGWQAKSKPNPMPNIEESLIHQESDKIDLGLPTTDELSVDNSSRKTFKPVSILRYDQILKNKANSKDKQSHPQQQEHKLIQPQQQHQGQKQGQAQTQGQTQTQKIQTQASIQKPVQLQQAVVVQAQQQAQVHERRRGGAGVKKIRFAVKEDKRGVEYYLQEQDGKVSLVDGDQLLEKYPKELLTYLEGLLVKHEAK